MQYGRRQFLARMTGVCALAAGARGDDARTGRSGDHILYEFSGSPFQVGFQHGRALSKEIVHEASGALAALAKATGAPPERALDRVVRTFEGLFREYAPDALEEIRGMAEGARLGYPYAFFAATRDGMSLSHSEGGCTAVVCGRRTTDGGRILIGQTKDTDAPLERYRIMRISYASGRRAILLNYPGWVGNLCLTSGGLSFTGNSLFAPEPSGRTTPFSLLKRLIAESASVRDVLSAIKPLRFPNLAMTIADSSGHLVYLESVAGDLRVEDVTDTAFGHANSILHGPSRRLDRSREASPSSAPRRKNVRRLLAARRGSIGADDLKRIFADHTGYPLSICRHPHDRDRLSTTAAFVADLTDATMDIAIGNPCTAEFKRYVLG